ncbi:hypothetical protein TWF281_001374 [Arthrobotrys megalospora]
MPRTKSSPSVTPLPANPENVKTVPFTGKGGDPASLVGLLLIGATPIHQYPLILSFRQPRKAPRDVEIHSDVLGRFFNIEVCDLLREHLPQASGVRPLKVIAAEFGSKRVEYSAPYSLKCRQWFKKKRTDEYNLIGLQLQGMDRMGWIWAEDLDRSFEEGRLKASVYIPTETVATLHRPRRLARLSIEDFKKCTLLKKVSNIRGGTQLVKHILESREPATEADLSPSEVAELQEMIEDLEAGRGDVLQMAIERKKEEGKPGIVEDLSDISELSEHDSVSVDGMDLDLDL